MIKILLICDDCIKQVDSEKDEALEWYRLGYKEEEKHFCSLKCVRNNALKIIQENN